MYQQWLQVIGLFFDGLGLRSSLSNGFAATVRCTAKSRSWPGTRTRSTRSITSERPMPGCSSLASSRSSLAWSCSFSFLGLGPDAAPSSALSPSRSDSQWTAVSLRGEAPHPVLVTPSRLGLDELQQLFGKRRTISQIVPRLLVDGSYPIPSSHWSFPVAEELSRGAPAPAARTRSSASRPQHV